MNIRPKRVLDKLVDLWSGLGVPGRDRLASTSWTFVPLQQSELEAAYRSDWIARKAVSLPAVDSTSKWRNWQADGDQIEAIEEVEKKFRIKKKIQEALIKARLYGGSLIVIGIEDDDLEKPLDLETVRKDSLSFVHVLTRYDVGWGAIDRNIRSEWFGEPEYWEIRGGDTTHPASRVHPSRAIRLIGSDAPSVMAAADPWGDSILQSVNDQIVASGIVLGSCAQLISDAKLDVVKIPDLNDIIDTAEGVSRLQKRFVTANANKSIWNMILLDREEEWQRIQVQFGGMPDVLQMYLLVTCGAVDVPSTRFLNRSPSGLQSTGESDLRNYHDRLTGEQESYLSPALESLDEVIIRTALGTRDKKIYYEWCPLWEMDEHQKADLAHKKALTFDIDQKTGLIPPLALAKARVNQLVEDGTYPGLEAAIAEAEAAGERLGEPPQLLPPPGGGPGDPGASGGQGGGPGGQGGPDSPGSDRPGMLPSQMRAIMGGRTDRTPFDRGQGARDYNPYHVESGEHGGEFTSGPGGGGGGGGSSSGTGKAGGGKAAGTATHTPHPRVVNVGGDEWNKETAKRLEDEYVTAKPAIEAAEKSLIGSVSEAGADSWDMLSEYQQTAAAEAFAEDVSAVELEYQVEEWHSNGDALRTAKTKIVDNFNGSKADNSEWVTDVIDEHRNGLEDSGATDIPYTNEQLIKAITLSYNDGNDEVTVDFDDNELMQPSSLGYDPEKQAVLPGIEEPKPASALTETMREDLAREIEAAFEEEAKTLESELDPPDYLHELVQESVDESWGSKSDAEKLAYVLENTSIITETSGSADEIDLPNKYDPLNETAGEDYKRTQGIARALSVSLATDAIIDRNLATGFDDPQESREAIRTMIAKEDAKLWTSWKGSSTSDHGLLLQLASAEELGGRINEKVFAMSSKAIEVIKKNADAEWHAVGGYEGVKAYVRGKWQATQYLLDKADVHQLELYRGLSFDRTEEHRLQYDEAMKTAESVQGGYTKLPAIEIDRNGAQSTTTDKGVANNWDGEMRKVVLRASIPRTAIVSVPAYGVNVESEHEVVVVGTAWVEWDAWSGKAPPVKEVPMGASGTPIEKTKSKSYKGGGMKSDFNKGEPARHQSGSILKQGHKEAEWHKENSKLEMVGYPVKESVGSFDIQSPDGSKTQNFAKSLYVMVENTINSTVVYVYKKVKGESPHKKA